MQLTAAAKGCMNGVLFPLKFPNICGIYDMYIVTESTVPHHPKIFKFFSLIFSPVKTFAGTCSEASSKVQLPKSFQSCAYAHIFNNRVCENRVYRIHSLFIKMIRVHIFRKHPRKIRDKDAAISRNLQRARSAKFPAQLATSAEREVSRAGILKRLLSHSAP